MPLGYAVTLDGRFLASSLSGFCWDDAPIDPFLFSSPDQAWEAVPVHVKAFDLDAVDVVPVYPCGY